MGRYDPFRPCCWFNVAISAISIDWRRMVLMQFVIDDEVLQAVQSSHERRVGLRARVRFSIVGGCGHAQSE